MSRYHDILHESQALDSNLVIQPLGCRFNHTRSADEIIQNGHVRFPHDISINEQFTVYCAGKKV